MAYLSPPMPEDSAQKGLGARRPANPGAEEPNCKVSRDKAGRHVLIEVVAE
jgi:hypothetical protein